MYLLLITNRFMNKLLYRIFKLATNSTDVKPHEMFLEFHKQNKSEYKNINIFLSDSNNDEFISFLNSKLSSLNLEELATFCMSHDGSESRGLDLTDDHIQSICKVLYEEFKSKINSYNINDPRAISKDLNLLCPIWSLINYVYEYLKYNKSKDIDKVTLYENKYIDKDSKELRLLSLLKNDTKFIDFIKSDFFHDQLDLSGDLDIIKYTVLFLYFIYCSVNDINSSLVKEMDNDLIKEDLNITGFNFNYNFNAYPEYIHKVFKLVYALIDRGMEDVAINDVLSPFLDNNYFPGKMLTRKQKEFIVEIAEKTKDYQIATFIASKYRDFSSIYEIGYPWVLKTVDEINKESDSYGH